jgi:prepilin-type N-terminal cleavage/methylation domain-containing protein
MHPKNNIHIKTVHNQSGFTLVEVLTSLVVLTVGIFGLIKTVDTVMYYQNKSSNTSRATLIVTNQIEEIKHRSVNEPGSKYGFEYLLTQYAADTGMVAINDTEFSINKNYVGANGEPEIKTTLILRTYPPEDKISFSNPDIINLVEVEVEAEWLDSKGNTRRFALGSVIHRRRFIE